MAEARDVSFAADGLTYRGLEWGDADAPVILALHGWLDNALSFSRLGPRLASIGYRVVALDLSGQGRSDWRSADSTYHIWDDLPQLQLIVEQISDLPIRLLGHSRGAAISALLACVLEARCTALAMIDGLLPFWDDSHTADASIRKFVFDRQKYQDRPARMFSSIEEYANKRINFGFNPENGYLLAERALERVEDGSYRLLVDPRLFGRSAARIEPHHRRDIYRSLKCKTLSIFGEQGLLNSDQGGANAAEASECIESYEAVTLPGGHHLHLDGDVDKVFDVLQAFFAEA